MKSKTKLPKLLGNLIALVGFFNVFANIFRPFRNATRHIDSYTLVYVNSTAFSTSLLSGLLLILISSGIKRRKRRAWTIAVLISAIGISAEAFRYHVHTEHILGNLLILVLLIIFRDEFYAKSDPRTKAHPFIGLGIGFLTFFVIGFLLILFRHSSAIVGSPSLKDIATTVIRGFIGLSGPVIFRGDRVNDTVFTTLLIFGIAIVCTPIWFYFGKVKPINQINLDEAAKIKEIVLNIIIVIKLFYLWTHLNLEA
mgnify:FL=1